MSNHLGLTICVCLLSLYLQQKGAKANGGLNEECLTNSTCSDTTLVCNTTGNVCIVRVPPLHQCNSSTPNPCVDHATCTNKGLCECASNYFDDRVNETCEQRVTVGEHCNVSITTTNMCVEGAICYHGELLCRCLPDYYLDTGKTCSKRKGTNEKCNDTQECIENSKCNTTDFYCHCLEDYYPEDNRHCQRKIGPGLTCNRNEACVANTYCDIICICPDTTHYAAYHTCHRRQHFDGPCNNAMCLQNGDCVNNRCQCDGNSYRYVQNDTCQKTLAVNTTCNIFNRDVKQCESNSKCVFRAWDAVPVCGCDVEHFFNGRGCEPRALAGDPCPFDPAPFLQPASTTVHIYSQCVENAHCSDLLICECGENFFEREGHCPNRIPIDSTCDPWADYPGQCAENGQCIFGRCVKPNLAG